MSTAPVAFTASQLEDQVRNLLSDNINFATTTPDGKDPQTWSPQQVYDALNYAIKEYCRATNASYTEAVASVDANGIATAPTDYLEIHSVFFPSVSVGS